MRSKQDKYDEELETTLLGEADIAHNTITLFKELSTYAPPCVAQTVMHEVVHVMLYKVGRLDLYDDETFVDNLASAMLEFLTSLE